MNLPGMQKSRIVSRYLPIFVMLWKPCSLSDVFDLEIISIIPNYPPIGVALPFARAALEVAVSDVRRQYPGRLNVSLTMLYNKDDRQCENGDANAPLLLAEYYNTVAYDRCVAVIVSGCGGLAIAPFLAKGMAGSIEDIAQALLELCRFFRWFHVTQLMDFAVESEIYGLIFQATTLLAGNDQRFSRLQLDSLRFDINSAQSVKSVLQLANARSRAYIILAHAVVVVRLLRSMKTSIAMSGDYVFIVIQPTQQKVYGPASLFSYPSAEDLPIFRSVLYLTTYALTGTESDELNNILTTREKLYGTILENGTQPLDLYGIRETYNSVQLFVALVNKSIALTETSGQDLLDRPKTCGGRKLQSVMLDKTFNFPSGQVYVDKAGYRHIDLVLFTFRNKSQAMEVSARYDSSNQSYIWPPNVTLDWSRAGPPLDVPICGFSGQDGPCSAAAFAAGFVIVPVVVSIALILVIVIIVCFVNYRKWRITGEQWWILMEDSLVTVAAVVRGMSMNGRKALIRESYPRLPRIPGGGATPMGLSTPMPGITRRLSDRFMRQFTV